MTMKRVMAALFAVPMVGLLLGALPTAAQAAPNPNLHVTSVTLSRANVVVSGTNTVPATVTVKGGYDSTDPSDQKLTLYVILERAGGTGPLHYLFSTDLPRTAGTVQDGTWSGPVNVPSTANGTFKVTGVFAGTFGANPGDMTDPTPYAGPSIAVKGNDIPKITAKVTPKIVPFNKPFSITWAVTNSATGKAYGSKIKVVLGGDNVCAENFGPGYTNLTGTNGLITKSYPAGAANFLNCLILPGNPSGINGLGFFVARPGIVAAAPSKTSAPVGSLVPVNGSVAGPPSGCPVNLQRLYGATAWRTVGTTKVRQSGRFTLTAQPAYKGPISYRVSFPACTPYVAGVSKAFSIRGL
ncbi:hypothetical protein [Kribbella sp. NPDC055071]